MVGEHFLKGWARTQNSVTLSSAEAELVAMGKAAAELIGVGAMSRDFGDETDGVLHADSSAAIAIAKRRGSGKLRHINIASLWIQEKIEQKELTVKKVSGLANPADMMTKHLGREKLETYMRAVGQEVREGRAEGALELQKGGGGEEKE